MTHELLLQELSALSPFAVVLAAWNTSAKIQQVHLLVNTQLTDAVNRFKRAELEIETLKKEIEKLLILIREKR